MGSTFLTSAECCSDRCAFKLFLPIPLSRSLAMADANVWVSVYFPHTRFGQMRWCKRSGRKNARAAQGRGEPASRHSLAVLQRQPPATRRTRPLLLRPLLSLRPRRHRGLLPNSSAWIGTLRPTKDGPYQPGQPQGQSQSSPWVSSSPAPQPPPDRSCTPTTPPVCLPHGIKSPVACDADDGLVASKQWTARCVYGWTKSVPSTERMTAIGKTLGASSSPQRRAGMTHFWRTLYPDREPPPDHSFPELHLYSALALRPDQKNRRPSEQIHLIVQRTFILADQTVLWATPFNDSRCVLHIAVRRHDARSRLLLE